MALVKISRGADIQHNYVNGVSRVSILEMRSTVASL